MQLFAVNQRTYTGIQEKTVCIRDCAATTRIPEEKEGKMISKFQITPTGHYWENIPLDLTQKQINKEQFKNIVYPIPKEKTTRNLPNVVANSIMEKLPMAWGYHNRQY